MSPQQIRAITIDPPARRWSGLLHRGQAELRGAEFLGRSRAEWVAISRAELLGAAAGGPAVVLGTGHQAGFWHPGILAKYLALAAAALRRGGDAGTANLLAVEVVVDQEVSDALALRVPMNEGGEGVLQQRLRSGTVVWGPGAESGEVPLGLRSVVEPGLGELTGVVPASAAAGLGAMVEELERAGSTATNLAEQLAVANAALRDEIFGEPSLRRRILFASKLAESSIWRALLAELRRDPRRAAETYNEAVRENPGAGIALLEVATDKIELPLWKIAEGESTGGGRGLVRERLFADDLATAERIEGLRCWPRALLLTGVVRLVLVDLFIHGLGGRRYDRVTETWLRKWLGVELAPVATVSADVRLDFGLAPATVEDVSAARWELHHLRYNLDRVAAAARNDPSLLAEKQELLARIEGLPRRSAARSAVYRELQALNERWRIEEAARLAAAARELAARELALAERAVLAERRWAFPLYEREVLWSLRDRIAEQFEVAGEVTVRAGSREWRAADCTGLIVDY